MESVSIVPIRARTSIRAIRGMFFTAVSLRLQRSLGQTRGTRLRRLALRQPAQHAIRVATPSAQWLIHSPSHESPHGGVVMKSRSASAPYFGVVLVIGATALVSMRAAQAANPDLIVTKFTDSLDGHCDSDCSLREAVQ